MADMDGFEEGICEERVTVVAWGVREHGVVKFQVAGIV